MNYLRHKSKSSNVIDKKNYTFELVKECIRHEKRAGRHLEKVILSRFQYDNLEAFLREAGIIDENNEQATLTCFGVVIERATTAIAEQIIPVYVQSQKDHSVLEKNLATFTKDKLSVGDIISKK